MKTAAKITTHIALTRHDGFHKKIKELERRDVELHATPEELFFSKEERRF